MKPEQVLDDWMQERVPNADIFDDLPSGKEILDFLRVSGFAIDAIGPDDAQPCTHCGWHGQWRMVMDWLLEQGRLGDELVDAIDRHAPMDTARAIERWKNDRFKVTPPPFNYSAMREGPIMGGWITDGTTVVARWDSDTDSWITVNEVQPDYKWAGRQES